MNISFYIPTYNRPEILNHCLTTLLSNAGVKPNELWVIDDSSKPETKQKLLNFSLSNYSFPINLIIHGQNYGIGYTFERIYNLMRQNDDLDIACIIESDYIWRKGWIEDCLAVFKASPSTIAIAGTDHPDMYDRLKTHTTFPEIMKECFGKDLDSRNSLYIPFDLDTEAGNIKVQGVSNSCGCMIIHWARLKNIIKNLEEQNVIPKNDFWRRMDRAFNKGVTHDTRRNASDGWMSSTISMYGELFLKLNNQDINKNFPMISICDYSISQHVCGGGVNGGIVPEGSTFILSPTWKDEYLDKNPRT